MTWDEVDRADIITKARDCAAVASLADTMREECRACVAPVGCIPCRQMAAYDALDDLRGLRMVER